MSLPVCDTRRLVGEDHCDKAFRRSAALVARVIGATCERAGLARSCTSIEALHDQSPGILDLFYGSHHDAPNRAKPKLRTESERW